MGQNEKMKIVRALMKAENAFHKALQEEGYHLEYGLGEDLMKNRGAIIDDNKKPLEFGIVGYVTITKELTD